MPLPANGVIYVDNGACPTTQSPLLPDYNEAAGCANVTVTGTYSKNLTIGSARTSSSARGSIRERQRPSTSTAT